MMKKWRWIRPRRLRDVHQYDVLSPYPADLGPDYGDRDKIPGGGPLGITYREWLPREAAERAAHGDPWTVHDDEAMSAVMAENGWEMDDEMDVRSFKTVFGRPWQD